MADVGVQTGHQGPDVRSREAGAAGSIGEALAGAGAMVLAIIGLAGYRPLALGSIGAIVLGAAFLLGTGAIASRLYVAVKREGSEVPSDLSGGLGAESLAGLGAIALGILALAGAAPLFCLPLAILVLGAGLLFGSAATWRVNYPSLSGDAPNNKVGYVAREGIRVASSAHAIVGIGALALGILALLDFAPLTLVLVAVLAVGGATVLSGAAVGGRFLAPLRR